MSAVSIRKARHGDEVAIAEMMARLWPDGSAEEFRTEAEALIKEGANGSLPAAVLLAFDDDETAIGFLQVGLRSHADGCDPKQPVGFVEGWFVREGQRGRGIGAELMRAAEEWARERGCLELASDAVIDNNMSHRAHAALGFEIVDRCVHFRKRL